MNGRWRLPSVPRRNRSRIRCLTAAAAAVGVLAACGQPTHPDGRASGSPAGLPTATATISPSASSTNGPIGDVRKLLRARAKGLLDGDRSAFLAPLDGAARSLQDRQATFYDNIHGVPLASWVSTLDPRTAQRMPGAGAESWSYSVVTVYAFDGLSDEKAVLDQRVDVARRPEGWRITDIADQHTRIEPWDIGRTTAVHDGRIVVLGIGASERELTAIERQAAAAVPRVDAVWRGRWEHGTVVVMPADATEAAALSGTEQIEPLAAVATGGSGVDAAGHLHRWDRVVINPSAWKRMSAIGRLVVLTHELTHVATLAGGRDGLSSAVWWLVEGIADYAMMLNQSLGDYDAIPEVRKFVRDSWDGDPAIGQPAYGATTEEAAARYGVAFLAVWRMAESYGQDAMLDFFGKVVHDNIPLEDAAPAAYGESWDAVKADCEQFIRDV